MWKAQFAENCNIFGRNGLHVETDINNDRKCAMNELNNKTIEISNKIKNAGYNLIEMYECSWNNLLDL